MKKNCKIPLGDGARHTHNTVVSPVQTEGIVTPVHDHLHNVPLEGT